MNFEIFLILNQINIILAILLNFYSFEKSNQLRGIRKNLRRIFNPNLINKNNTTNLLLYKIILKHRLCGDDGAYFLGLLLFRIEKNLIEKYNFH